MAGYVAHCRREVEVITYAIMSRRTVRPALIARGVMRIHTTLLSIAPEESTDIGPNESWRRSAVHIQRAFHLVDIAYIVHWLTGSI